MCIYVTHATRAFRTTTCREREFSLDQIWYVYFFLATKGHGEHPRMRDQLNTGATSEITWIWQTIQTIHIPIHANKVKMKGWLWRPNNIRGRYGHTEPYPVRSTILRCVHISRKTKFYKNNLQLYELQIRLTAAMHNVNNATQKQQGIRKNQCSQQNFLSLYFCLWKLGYHKCNSFWNIINSFSLGYFQPKTSWHLSYWWGNSPKKNLSQENCPDRESNPGPLRDRCACYLLLRSGGPWFQ